MKQQKKLTKRMIDALPVPTGKDREFYWDAELPTFGIAVMASGARSFVVQTRINGRSRRITIGRYGALTVDNARDIAKARLGEIAAGGDPIKAKARKDAASVTLSKARDDYLAARKSLKPRTVADIEKTFRQYLSDWMDLSLGSVTDDMVKRRHSKIGTRSPAQANLAMRYLRTVYNFAIAEYTGPDGEPILARNPVTKLSRTRAWFKVERRRTVIKRYELRPWMQAVQALKNDIVRDYFMLVLLTGLRRTESLGLRWDDVDLAGGTLTIPDPKNRQSHTLPLSDYLHDMLTARSELRFRKGKEQELNELVFESPQGPLANLRYGLERVRKDSSVSFSMHDLRRTFATVAESIDLPAYTVKALLNHKLGTDVTAGYIVIDTERLRVPMQQITDFMLVHGGLKGPAGGAQAAVEASKVVDFQEHLNTQASRV